MEALAAKLERLATFTARSECALLRRTAGDPQVWSAYTSRDRRFSSSDSAAPSIAASGGAEGQPGPGSHSSGAPGRVPVERLQQAITPAVCEALRRDGFAVLDGVFGEAAAAGLRAEVAALRRHMHKNHTHLVQGGATGLLEKEHIWEAELLMRETQALAPLCAQLQGDPTLRVMLSLLLPQLRLQAQAIKLQYNAGSGGCFPMHFDSDAALDGRQVTAILYLNPGWQPGDGGELRLYPFPQQPVDVAPLHDRLVLFSSRHMLHRVLPSRTERFCLTVWLSEGHPGRGGDGGGGAEGREELRRALAQQGPLGAEEAWGLLMHPQLRRHAAKWRLRDEWERSIRESHPQGPALAAALETFRAEVGVVRRALGPLLPALAAGVPERGAPHARWF